MSSSAYRRGADFERRLKTKLEAQGHLVFRTAGSHGVADLIAFPPLHGDGSHRPALIQCKSGARKISTADRNALRQTAATVGAEALIATRGLQLEAA